MYYLELVKNHDEKNRSNLIEIGKYVAECLPKYVQQSQITSTDELEVLIHPDGVVPVLSFLKENHKTQFHAFIAVTAIDVPTRPYRFEVFIIIHLSGNFFAFKKKSFQTITGYLQSLVITFQQQNSC